jgi:hypothetical protein
MAQEESRIKDISIKDVIDYVSDKGPEQLKAEVDDFISDMKNICKAVDTLYEEKFIPLSIRGFAVEIKIIDQNFNLDFFVHETGKSASGKSLMQHIREIVGAEE